MAVTIPKTVFANLVQWMARGPWPRHLQQAIHDHLDAFCDNYDLNTFDELADKIGRHWVTCLNDIAMNDFLSRNTEDGNVVDLYLKKRGWKERPIAKAYLRGIRNSVMSLYEVSDVRPGESFMAHDMILDREPIRVEERSGTQSMLQQQHLAMRLVEVRGHWIIAGSMLPYAPKLSKMVIEKICWLVRKAETEMEDMQPAERARYPDPEVLRDVAMTTAVKVFSPLICAVWLAETMLDPADMTEGVCA